MSRKTTSTRTACPTALHGSSPTPGVGLTRLIRWIGFGSSVDRVVFEPTGRYQLELERRLDTAGLPVVKDNPRQAKRFAQSLGVRAKTDSADAAMRARMGTALALEPQPVKPEVLQDLNDLIAARRALMKDRTAAKNRPRACAWRSLLV